MKQQNLLITVIGILGISGCLLLIVFLAVVRIFSTLNAPDEKNIPPTISYEVGANNSNLIEVWSKPDVFVDSYSNRGGSQIVAARETVFINGRLTKTGKYRVSALNAENCTLMWQLPNHAFSLFATSSAVYLGFTDQVSAYDLRDGELIWSSEELLARNIFYLLVVDNLIYAHSTYAYLLRTDTGELVASLPEHPNEATLKKWGIDAPPEYFNNFADVTLIEDTKFIRGVAEFRGEGVRAIDLQTEEILWEMDRSIISNVVATETTLYLITYDRKLLGLDVRTGEVVSTIQFKQKSPISGDVRHSTGGYYVAVDKDAGFVYAYLGGSEQLFAFKVVE